MEGVLDFLTLVWGERMGWVDIPSKSGGHWMTFTASWPEDKPLIRRRVESCLADEEDVYFSVCMFGAEGRRLKDTKPTAWLWADLDRVDPVDCAALDLEPTVCWESSPFRYQALWKLGKGLVPQDLARLNKALTYAIGGDRGGWDLTQVLRPVGTRNFKYRYKPEVMLVYDDGPEYEARELYRRLKDFVPPKLPKRQSISSDPRREVGARNIPARARALLAVPPERVVEGERSTRLWELECLLVEAGLEEDQIFTLVERSAWNKWPNSPGRLHADIAKAIDKVERRLLDSPPAVNGGRKKAEAARTAVRRIRRVDEVEAGELDLTEPSAEVLAEEEANKIELPFLKYSGFMAQDLEAPRWLIQDLWMAQSHGIVGGEAKSSKSLLALAMGLSIASGEPFLGQERFGVTAPGPVLMIQEENSPWDVQDKLRKLARLYGLISSADIERTPASEGSVAGQVVRLDFPTDAPLLILNNFGFDMSQEEYREALEERIEREGAAMVILDPLYLMLGAADADRAHEVRPFQQWLLHLRYTYRVAVVLVHHFGKPREGDARRAGHRLLGSGTWYNWVDSAMYSEAKETEVGWFDTNDHRGSAVNRRMIVAREWRSAAPQGTLDLRMHMGDPGSLKLIVDARELDTRDIRKSIEVLVDEAGEEGILLTEIAATLNFNRKTVRKYVVGSGNYDVKGTPRGRGQSFRVWQAGKAPAGA